MDPDRSDALRDGYVTHPMEEKLPHHQEEPKRLESSRDFNKLGDTPTQLRILFQFLADELEQFDKEKLSFLTVDQDAFYAEALDEKSLVFLDRRDDRLVYYDTESHDYAEIAPQGRGPGDVAFTQELQKVGQKLFVGMQGYRLSLFNCNERPCDYVNTINTDFNIYSVAPANDQLAIIGLLPFGREGDPDPENTDQFAVHLVDEFGDIKNSFHPVYNDKSPTVRERVNAHGSIRFFEESETYVVVFNKLPYIYAYNASGELLEKYKIPEFEQRLFDYHEEDLMGRERYHRDHSYITHAEKVDDKWLLMTMRERENLSWVERELHFDETYRYLGFYLPGEKLYEIGHDKTRSHDERRSIYPTDYGLVVNEQGTLYWVGQ